MQERMNVVDPPTSIIRFTNLGPIEEETREEIMQESNKRPINDETGDGPPTNKKPRPKGGKSKRRRNKTRKHKRNSRNNRRKSNRRSRR